MFPQSFIIPAIDEYGKASRRLSTIYIAPAIAYHEALARSQTKPRRRIEYHTRFGLAAGASCGLPMITGEYLSNLQLFAKRGMHPIYSFPRNLAVSHIRLIGHDNQGQAGSRQTTATFRSLRIKLEILEPTWRIGFAAANLGPVEHPVPIQKNGPVQSAFDPL